MNKIGPPLFSRGDIARAMGELRYGGRRRGFGEVWQEVESCLNRRLYLKKVGARRAEGFW